MKKTIISIVFVIFLICMGSGCDDDTNATTVDREQAQKQKESLQVMRDKVGEPDIKNFEEAKTLKEIYEDRDNPKIICYWYTTNAMTGKLVYQGRCKGYGIPYSTQFSNPERIADLEDEIGEHSTGYWFLDTVPQAEPNGLFMPTSSSATWVLAINDDDTISVEYKEDLITVSKVKKPKRLCEEWSLPDDY